MNSMVESQWLRGSCLHDSGVFFPDDTYIALPRLAKGTDYAAAKRAAIDFSVDEQDDWIELEFNPYGAYQEYDGGIRPEGAVPLHFQLGDCLGQLPRLPAWDQCRRLGLCCGSEACFFLYLSHKHRTTRRAAIEWPHRPLFLFALVCGAP